MEENEKQHQVKLETIFGFATILMMDKVRHLNRLSKYLIFIIITE